MEVKNAKKIEIILTPKENSNGYNIEFIVNKDEFNGNATEVTALLVSAAYNFGYKNLDTTQFIAFLAATKDMCKKQEELALINDFLNTFEKEKTNE